MSSAILRRTAFSRISAFSTVSVRPISTTIALRKTMTESVKESVHNADVKVGQTLAAGIEGAEKATESVKETVSGAVGNAKANSPSPEEAKGMAKGKGEEIKGEVKGKANELSGKAKGTYEEAKGKASGAAQ